MLPLELTGSHKKYTQKKLPTTLELECMLKSALVSIKPARIAIQTALNAMTTIRSAVSKWKHAVSPKEVMEVGEGDGPTCRARGLLWKA